MDLEGAFQSLHKSCVSDRFLIFWPICSYISSWPSYNCFFPFLKPWDKISEKWCDIPNSCRRRCVSSVQWDDHIPAVYGFRIHALSLFSLLVLRLAVFKAHYWGGCGQDSYFNCQSFQKVQCLCPEQAAESGRVTDCFPCFVSHWRCQLWHPRPLFELVLSCFGARCCWAPPSCWWSIWSAFQWHAHAQPLFKCHSRYAGLHHYSLAA